MNFFRHIGRQMATDCVWNRARQCLLGQLRINVSATFRQYHNTELEYGKGLDSGHFSGTMEEVAEMVRKQVGVEVGYHTIPKCRANLLKHQPKPNELPPRRMKDSYTTAVLPLGNDEGIRERYVNHLGRVRLGRILEDMDMFAVWICHRHVELPKLPENTPLPYTFVTLLVDKVEFFKTRRLDAENNINLSGYVSWVGHTSMEITIYIRQCLAAIELTTAKAIFMMVARNAMNTGPAPVNPLEPANELEQSALEEATLRRKMLRTKSTFAGQPLKSEEELMHSLFTRTKGKDVFDLSKRTLPPNCRWMANSYHSTMIHPFPENRNTQNTIFGGYIMRNAIEISFITACIYACGRPLLECISDISFLSPVKVNSFLKLTAYIVYTARNYMQIMTVAHILDANSLEETTTNAFYLTYAADHKVQEVLPRTYHETLWFLHGRRKFLDIKGPDFEQDDKKLSNPDPRAKDKVDNKEICLS